MGLLTDVHGRGVFSSRPAAGHAGRFYYSTDTSVNYRDNGSSWDAQSTSGMTNPMTTAGDTIYGGASGAPTRLAGSTSGYVMTSNGPTSAPSWQAAPGGGSGALVFIDAQTASGSAQLDFTGIDGTYDALVFELVDILPATDAVDLQMRVGTGGTPTYDTGNNYHWTHAYSFGATQGVEGATGVSIVRVRGSVSNTLLGTSGSVRLYKPSSASLYKGLTYHTVSYVGAVGTIVQDSGGGMYTSTTAVTAVRFFMSSGNIASGVIRRYGIVNS